MKLSDQVCSSELAKKLEKLEIKQDSLWYWSDYESDDLNDYLLVSRHYKLICGDVVKSYFISAFTVAELGEMIKDNVVDMPKWMSKWIPPRWGGNTYMRGYSGEEFWADTEADVRAKMLIYLIENKYVKKEEG